MQGFLLFLGVTAVMGLSIFLSMPVVFHRRAQGRWAVGLNAAAIGILIFLLGDIFSDVAPILYPSGYVANAWYTGVFAIGFLAAFLGLYGFDRVVADRRGEAAAARAPLGTAVIVATGIGLQNLTEGLVFGVNWTAGALGILAVVFVGFFLQNVTEGFPIVAPYLGTNAPRSVVTFTGLFLIGGLPTLLGGAIGYFWSNDTFLVAFDALAIGAIAYVILPMLRGAFRPLETRELSVRRDQIVYLGVMAGFVIGFLVNAL